MQKTGKMQLLLTVVAVLLCGLFHTLQAQSFRASDPGVRGGAPRSGLGPLMASPMMSVRCSTWGW